MGDRAERRANELLADLRVDGDTQDKLQQLHLRDALDILEDAYRRKAEIRHVDSWLASRVKPAS